jgi:hypothetical protein
MSDLRKATIKLAYDDPEIRPHLLPLLEKTAGTSIQAGKDLSSYYGSGGPDAPIFKMVFKNGDAIYFKPASKLKNGNWKGKQVSLYVGERPTKAKNTSISKGDFRAWKEDSKVPANVLKKF